MAPTRLAYEDVANQLREQILAGELTAGSRLPSEAELCERFHVSRSTVREALRMLSSQRLVTTSRGVGGGSSVTQPGAGDLVELLGDAVMLLSRSEGASMAEMLEVRELLEVPAARLAAVRRSDEQLQRLAGAIPPPRGGGERVGDGCFFQASRAFHDILLEMAGNRVLQLVAEPLFAVIEALFQREMASASAWEHVVVADHQAIWEAVAGRDADRAAQSMSEHLSHLRATYERMDRRRRRPG